MEYGNWIFRDKVVAACQRVKKVLNDTREPVKMEDAVHEYADKFMMAERAVDGGLASLRTVMAALGLEGQPLEQAFAWAVAGSVVTLRFAAEERCTFARTVERWEDSSTQHVLSAGDSEVLTSKYRSKIIEHFWTYEHAFVVSVYRADDAAAGIELQRRMARTELVTTGDVQNPPRPQHRAFPAKNCELTAFLKRMADPQSSFKIDRSHKDCHTPRRNRDVDQILEASSALDWWGREVRTHLLNTVFELQRDKLGLSSPNLPQDAFVPIIPLFAPRPDGEVASQRNELLSLADMDKLMEAYRNDVLSHMQEAGAAFPAPDAPGAELMSSQEAALALTTLHFALISETLSLSIDHVENMLRAQLVKAIGKEVTPQMVAEYMDYHYRKLFAGEVVRPFSYDIKREGFAPEGTLSIESDTEDGAQPVGTFVRRISADEAPVMRFALSAATKAEMNGPQYVHGFLTHRFAGATTSTGINLAARARQFSSFVLLVGRIAAKDEFAPKHAIILQNKDSALIPLMLDPLPSAKAFRDAIESLSPEQQTFARALRAMQLESTLFGVAVVEIKPQLEALLGLPNGALTKEIKLTQNLVELFVEYQVPCDLVTYDGAEGASLGEKVDRVRTHVKALLDMIDESKKEQLESEKKKAFNAQYEQNNLLGDIDALTKSVPVQKSSVRRRSAGVPMSDEVGSVRKKSAAAYLTRSAGPRVLAASAPPLAQMQLQQQQQRPPPKSHQPPPQQGKASAETEPTAMEFEEEDEVSAGIDLTKLPAELDRKLERLDKDAALRPTKIGLGSHWRLARFQNLLTRTAENSSLGHGELRKERHKAIDLLDALSRSGELPLIATQLHVVVASTHGFDKTVMETVIQDNVNVLERIEKSSLLIASSVLARSVFELVVPSQRARLSGLFPELFDEAEG